MSCRETMRSRATRCGRRNVRATRSRRSRDPPCSDRMLATISRSSSSVWIASDSLGGRKPNRRSEEHTSELQSHLNLVCRLLLEKKKKKNTKLRNKKKNKKNKEKKK